MNTFTRFAMILEQYLQVFGPLLHMVFQYLSFQSMQTTYERLYIWF